MFFVKHHSCSIINGELYYLGLNNYSPGGLGDNKDYYIPQKIGSENTWVQKKYQ